MTKIRVCLGGQVDEAPHTSAFRRHTGPCVVLEMRLVEKDDCFLRNLSQVVHDADTIGQELIGSRRQPNGVRLTVTLEDLSAEAWNS